MSNLFWIFLSGLLSGLLVAAGLRLRARLRARVGPPAPLLDDEAIRRIEHTGTFATDEDEPLDWGDIEEEERRFWASEEWDEAEEW